MVNAREVQINGNKVLVTRAWFEKFKQKVEEVKQTDKTQFEFIGNEFNLFYAEYLIEYLEPKFK